MDLVGGIIIVLGFLIFIELFKIVEKSARVISISKSSMATMRDKSLGDDQKEVAMQKNAKSLFVLFFIITIGSALAVAIPLGIVWLMEQAKWLTVDEVIKTTLSWEFLGGTLVVSVAYFWLIRKKMKPQSSTSTINPADEEAKGK